MLSRFIFFRIDLIIKEFFNDKLIKLPISLIALVIVLNKIISVGHLYLHQLLQQFFTYDSSEGSHYRVELFIKSCHIETTEFERKIIQA